MSGQQMLMHLGVGLAALAFGLALFALRLFGGGDTKLFAVAALWIGYDQLALFVAYVTIAGGALAFLLIAYRSMPVGAVPLPAWAARLHHRGEGMPYGVAIAAGALTIFPQTAWSTLLAG
jgi:prepilin peptidase CpaA